MDLEAEAREIRAGGAAMLTRRAVALVVDGVIVSAVVALPFMVGEAQELYSQLCAGPWSVRGALFLGTVFVLPFVFYEGLLLHLSGRTLGKRLFGIQVVDRNGARLCGRQAWLRPCARVALRWLSPIDYGAALLTRDAQCLHDVLSGTRVVRVAAGAKATDVRPEPLLPSERKQRAFWVKWAAASLIGWTAGVILNEATADAMFGGSSRTGFLFAASTGLGMGAGQALLLRRHVARAWLWIPATIAGFVAGENLAGRVEADLDTVSLTASAAAAWVPGIAGGLALQWITGWCTTIDAGNQAVINAVWRIAPLSVGIVLGAALGLAQWIVIRRSVARAVWWAAANVAMMAFITAFTFERAAQQRILGIWLGLALIAFQLLVLRWRVAGASWWVAALTMAAAYGLGANEGDFTFAALMSLVTGLAMTGVLSGPRRTADALRGEKSSASRTVVT